MEDMENKATQAQEDTQQPDAAAARRRKRSRSRLREHSPRRRLTKSYRSA